MYHLLAIDKENRHYLLLNERDLKECIQDIIRYTYKQNWPMYHVQEDAPREVQIYVKTSSQTKNCEKRHNNKYHILDNFIGITILIVFYTWSTGDSD